VTGTGESLSSHPACAGPERTPIWTVKNPSGAVSVQENRLNQKVLREREGAAGLRIQPASALSDRVVERRVLDELHRRVGHKCLKCISEQRDLEVPGRNPVSVGTDVGAELLLWGPGISG
jgi:hypothetical protein